MSKLQKNKKANIRFHQTNTRITTQEKTKDTTKIIKQTKKKMKMINK
jgi:hypothetical protein